MTTVRSLQDDDADYGADAGSGGIDAMALYQAQGMVVVQLSVNLAEAMTQIRAYAEAQQRPVAEVAREIVERRLLLDGDTVPR